MTDIAKLAQAIQPGLTLYGVLLTFAIISFTVGKYFWEYEKTLITESVTRLKELLDGHRTRFVEPILRRELGAAISAAYDEALLGLIGDIYGNKGIAIGGEVHQTTPADADILRDVSEAAIRQRLDMLKRSDASVDAFLSSSSGKSMYEELDRAYRTATNIWQMYMRARDACWKTSYSFLTLFLFLLAGMIQLVLPWPLGLSLVWIFISVLLFMSGLYAGVRLEIFRRRLLSMWEELQVYGKV